MKIKKIISMALLFISAVLGGCKLEEPRWGREYNVERKKLGIPIIPDDWVPNVDTYASCTLWENPEFQKKYDAHIPVHSYKDVCYKANAIIAEGDVYEGPNDYMTVDGPRRERLVIGYVYQEFKDESNEIIKPGWFSTYTNLRGEDVEITLEEAKAILEAWGIPFP